jgi:hypothetical protein
VTRLPEHRLPQLIVVLLLLRLLACSQTPESTWTPGNGGQAGAPGRVQSTSGGLPMQGPYYGGSGGAGWTTSGGLPMQQPDYGGSGGVGSNSSTSGGLPWVPPDESDDADAGY